MATIDDSLKVFFKEHKTTAALINWMFFGGQKVVQPSQIQESTVDESFFHFGDNDRFKSLSRQRDVCKVVSCFKDGQRSYMVVGIENQTTVDQFMVGRALAMNMMNYLWQYEVISDRNRSRPTTTRDSGEFLYGFHMDDRLSPVITLVIHWGRMKWTAPLSFHELVKDTMPSVRDYIPNFRLPLLVATDFAEKKQHIDEPNLDLLLHYVGNVFAGKRKEFQVELDTNPFYQNIRAATGQCINAITGDCLPVPGNPEETFSMKTAGELYREELRNEGRKAGMKAGMKAGRKAGMKAGRKEGMKEGKQIFFRMFVESSRRKNRSDAEIQQFLMEDFKLTSEEAKELVNQ